MIGIGKGIEQAVGLASGGASSSGKAGGADFASFMTDGLQSAIDGQKQAEQLTQQAAGGKADLLSVITAVNNAESTLQTIVNMRDRFVQALQEIMRTAV